MSLLPARLGVGRLGATRLGLTDSQESLAEEFFEVIVLDASAVGLSCVRRDTKTLLVTAEEGNARYRSEGQDPTSEIGHVLEAGDLVWFTRQETLSKLRFVTASGSPVLTVTYFTPYTNPLGEMS